MVAMQRNIMMMASKVLPSRVKKIARKYYTPHSYIPHGESILSRSRLDRLANLVERVIQEGLPGDIIECGVFRGGSAIQMGTVLQRMDADQKVIAIDLFDDFKIDQVIHPVDGLDEWNVSRVNKKFSGSRFHKVTTAITEHGLSDQVQVYQGAFAEVFPQLNERKFCLAHIDCDFYSSVKDCLVFLREKLVPGGIAVFDDYGNQSWPGVKLALSEFIDSNALEVLPDGQALWVK
jgi:predicted O-methyltransferase YrrM